MIYPRYPTNHRPQIRVEKTGIVLGFVVTGLFIEEVYEKATKQEANVSQYEQLSFLQVYRFNDVKKKIDATSK